MEWLYLTIYISSMDMKTKTATVTALVIAAASLGTLQNFIVLYYKLQQIYEWPLLHLLPYQ
jgi:hypothetical protein